ncbi:MAG TPA: hypothetical protein VJH34_04395 [archaeon]|nr:hypothetical protein [archaeon]
MTIIPCPSCKTKTREILACDNCNKLACVRCTSKKSKQRLCLDCKKGNYYTASNQTTPQSGTSNSGFPNWF